MNKNLLMGIAFLAAGIGLAAWGFMNLSKAMESKSWPTADGKIVSSKVVKKTESYTDSDRRRKTRTLYEAQVRYDYNVGGRSLIGGRITMADSSSSSESRAKKISKRCRFQQQLGEPGKKDQQALPPRQRLHGIL